VADTEGMAAAHPLDAEPSVRSRVGTAGAGWLGRVRAEGVALMDLAIVRLGERLAAEASRRAR